jgi:hypothetical protein
MLSIIFVLISILAVNINANTKPNPPPPPSLNSKKNLKLKLLDLLVFNNEDCYENYFKYVKPMQYENKNNKIDISFIDYLEYWWDSEESIDELIRKVCRNIEEKKLIKIINYQNNKLSEFSKIKMLI